MRWGGLFFKYVVLFVGLVSGVLVINAALDLYFVYQENRRASIEVQREKAESAAQRVESFVREIERQIGWVAYAQFAALPAEQRRFDYVRLMRQVPAITELVQLDRQGREQLRVSRLSMDAVGAGTDRSAEPAFVEAMANKVYFGPVYYRKESEPYLTMAVAHGTGRSGVTVAEINLKLILDVVSQIKIGRDGYTYVVDRQGRLIAHPDISLVLRGTDMSRLSQVAAALAPPGDGAAPEDARNRAGISVLSANATIPALGWTVFVEVPTREAQQPVIDAGLRTLALLVLGLIIAGLAGALLARRMVVPIRTLQAGAARMGSGDLNHRLSIETGDELEALANQFNRSAAALEDSYATLERRVEDRTRELSESLEQQTATAEILRAISQSPTDVRPVLDVVAAAARRFCGASDAAIVLRDGEELLGAAHDGPLSAWVGERRPLDRASTTGRAIVDGHTVHTPDIDALDPVEFAAAIEMAHRHKWRANIVAPMLREGTAVGCIVLRKTEAGAFTPRQIALLETFAAQAVIAIENVRLFTELKESLEQQTATAEILQVISQSPTDVQPVLDAVVGAARRFCGAADATIVLREGDELVLANHEGMIDQFLGTRLPIDASTTAGRSVLEMSTFHIPNVDEVTPGEYALTVDLSKRANVRAVLAAPMLREGEAIGCILLRRPEPGAFTPRQIHLLEAFAAQAVIAIENVRLFTELRDSLERLKAAQANLVQSEKMASLGQLTAGIAHEIKNPLNFINNFAGLSVELLAEIKEVAAPAFAQLDDDKRAEIDETMALITGNLEKIAEHGRRADGIVKSMLSHSRGGTGDWQASNINALVEEALNLAYHGARAQDNNFNVTLERDLAPAIKAIEVVPQDITRVFLNLIGNGFYAANKRRLAENAGFKPHLRVSTRDFGETVEIRVRDNGTGIPDEVRAKLFQPFFTTKPTGEGTGLGLSISYDIVTQQHGGALEVESEVGSFTEFTVRLPRSRRVVPAEKAR